MSTPKAFPYQHNNGSHGSGMSLRDYFAAKAMQALIASDGKIAQMCKEAGIEPLEAVPIAAYSMADAMIEMREKM